MTREQREALKAFFVYCYERAAQLDDPKWKDENDLPKMLMAIRANARVGYYEVTGDWLSTIQAGGKEAPPVADRAARKKGWR